MKVRQHIVLPNFMTVVGGIFALTAWAHFCRSSPPEAIPSPSKVMEIEFSKAPVNADAKLFAERDPVYDGPRTYLGGPLRDYLQAFSPSALLEAEDTIVQFICSDGYSPIANLSILTADKAFLAVRDAAAGPAKFWDPLPGAPSGQTPGPAYLVWPHLSEDPDHPWPYGIIKMRIGSEADLLGPLQPIQPRFLPGCKLFVRHCIKCHSMNGVGGALGVDLNSPRNVFEYWQADMLPDFIANPGSYRLHSKMPPFVALSRDSIAEILRYIESMKAQKQPFAP